MKKRIALLLVLGILMVALYACAEKDHRAITMDYYEKNKEDLDLIVEFLVQQEYLFLLNDNTQIVDLGNEYGADESVVSTVKNLMKQGCFAIIKRENTIDFGISRKFNDFGAGLAYSINQTDEPDISYLTKLEPLSDAGWYYYESDFNEWRIQNELNS